MLGMYYCHYYRMILFLASFPDLPAHPQTLYARLFLYPLKKLIACIMFAGEREGLGTRLLVSVFVCVVSFHT